MQKIYHYHYALVDFNFGQVNILLWLSYCQVGENKRQALIDYLIILLHSILTYHPQHSYNQRGLGCYVDAITKWVRAVVLHVPQYIYTKEILLLMFEMKFALAVNTFRLKSKEIQVIFRTGCKQFPNMTHFQGYKSSVENGIFKQEE